MATAALAKPGEAVKSLAAYLEARKGELAKVVPQHMAAERILKISLSACSRTPKLLQCDPASIYVALHTAAQLGLEPGSPLGSAYLVPFFNKNVGRMECQFIPGYRGLIDLARRSGHISTIYAHAVRRGDTFEFELGLEPKLRHIPAVDADGEITHVYACAHLKDGGRQFRVMTKGEVEKIRERSKSKDSGPWVTDWEAMALKTVVKQLVKFLPMSIELADAVDHDTRVESGEALGETITATIDATATELTVDEPVSRAATAKRLLKQANKPEAPKGDDLSIDDSDVPEQSEAAPEANRAARINAMVASGTAYKITPERAAEYVEAIFKLMSSSEINSALTECQLSEEADVKELGMLKLKELLHACKTIVNA